MFENKKIPLNLFPGGAFEDDERAETIVKNIRRLRERMAATCEKAGRNPLDVKLVAVSKNTEARLVNKAIAAGISDIGESKIQEIRLKYDELVKPIDIHLIGHVQRNKIKFFIGKVALIHSIDSFEIAAEVSESAKKIDKIQNALLQLNLLGDDEKYGITPKDMLETAKKIGELENIRVRGLMAMAPKTTDNNKIRRVFAELKEIFENLKARNLPNIDMTIISAGMTNDYEIAIEEGSTMVRVGREIFDAHY
jgi:pyridoxal phosphate enzyme (YggS family)